MAGEVLPLIRSPTHLYRRHFYEVIPEGAPCRLYLDVEHSRKANPEKVKEAKKWCEIEKGKNSSSYSIPDLR